MKIMPLILICLFAQIQTTFAQTPVNMGIINSKVRTPVTPKYPVASIKAQTGGAVNVNVTVDEQGNVIKADAVSGDIFLRDAAVTAAGATKFFPNIVKGKATKMSGILVFNFVAPPENSADAKAAPRIFETFDDLINSGEFNIRSIVSGMKNDDETIKYLTDGIIKQPNDSTLLAQRAAVYYGKNDIANALTDAQAALKLNPDETLALRVRAMIERDRSQINLANTDFAHAISVSTDRMKTKPAAPDNYFDRAESYRSKGEFDKSIADYRKGIELNPHNDFFKKRLDLLLEEQIAGKLDPISDRKYTRAIYEIDVFLFKFELKNEQLQKAINNQKTETPRENDMNCQVEQEMSVILENTKSIFDRMEKEKLTAYRKGRADYEIKNTDFLKTISAYQCILV